MINSHYCCTPYNVKIEIKSPTTNSKQSTHKIEYLPAALPFEPFFNFNDTYFKVFKQFLLVYFI
jgi:hypothetical protein